MDVREKLVELLRYVGDNIMDFRTENFMESLASFLIAQGVTVQEWISVTERLPAVGEDVLVITSSSDRNMAVWRLFGNAENRQAHWEDEVGDGLVLGAATHWMPLPEPPKEE